ncbi:MAG: hypothetical protein ACP5HK_02460 [Acidilobus sp.]
MADIVREVSVRTGARLHAGFYYAAGEWSVRWGSAGFYVDVPALEASFTLSSERCYEGPSELRPYMERAADVLGIGGFCARVSSSLPLHSGFGVGTQVSLASYRAFQLMIGHKPDPAPVASERLSMARVSGVGALLFDQGGFVMDAGMPGRPRTLLRLQVPEKWRFVIVVPDVGRGLDEQQEDEVMGRLQWGASESLLASMAEGALRLASGIAREDIDDAAEGLRELQRATGAFFARAQGGVYRGSLIDLAAEAWRHRMFLAQSSWGPAMYTLAEDEASAKGDADLLVETMREVGLKGRVLVVRPRNSAAEVSPVVLPD